METIVRLFCLTPDLRLIKMVVPIVNWNRCPSPLVLLEVMPTHINLVVVSLSEIPVVHHSHPIHQCPLRPSLGKHQTILARPIPTLMLHEHRLVMLLHILLILMQMEQGRQPGMLVLGRLILMRQDQMGVRLVPVQVQVGVAVVAVVLSCQTW